jgi:tryptophanyl-tRNA synthetase
LQILAAFEGRSVPELEDEMRGWGMREFKERVGEGVVGGLRGIRERFEGVRGDKGWLGRVRREGNGRAREVAGERIREIKRIVGLL